MDEVLHLLEQYRDDVEAEFPPQHVDDVFGWEGEGASRSRPVSSPRRWTVAVATAAMVLALLGGAAVLGLLIGQEETTVTTQSIPTTSLPTPTTSPSHPTTTLVAPAPAPLVEWEQVPAQVSLGAGDEEHEYVIHTVIEGGPGLIAAGRVRTAGGIYWYDRTAAEDQAAVWTSEDGVSWDRVDGSGLDGPGGYSIYDLTAGGPGYVAVGASVENGTIRPAIWVSENARVWTRVDVAGFTPDDELSAVVAGNEGVVAVGGKYPRSDIWFSPDGWDWQRIKTPSWAYLNDVAYADWGFVAAGRDYREVQDDDGTVGAEQRPIVATSPDGVTWEYGDLPESGTWFGAEATAITAAGDNVVVGGNYPSVGGLPGSILDLPPAFWRSTDGSTWDLSYIPKLEVEGIPGASAHIRSLAITDSGTVAVGGWWPPLAYQMRSFWTQPGWTDEMRNAVWISPAPGEPWREDHDEETFAFEELDTEIGTTMGFDDVAVLDGTLVGVSTIAGEVAVWIGEWNS